MITDSKSLFDIITKSKQTTERRLMIDMACVREAYQSHEISNSRFIRGPNNPADGLRKPNTCDSLERLIKYAKAE